MTVREIGARLRKRELSCVELVRQSLRAAQSDPYNSFITITTKQALAEAAERDAELASGVDRGPWHGVPVAYKDLLHTAGVKTTGASLLYRNFVPNEDAEVVRRFKAAGAISIGKTNLHELAYGATSQSIHFGPVSNPRNPECIPGGSSGGSAAAVAAGYVAIAIGTDTGGSIRIPASYCGVAGFKPTYGLVSRRGVMPLAFSLDHVGPMTNTVEDCSLAMQVMTGLESAVVRLEGLRVCLPENFFFDQVDGEVAAAVKRAARLMHEHGAVVEPARVPDLREANIAARVIQLAEAASLYARYEDSNLFGTDVWALIEQGRRIAAYDYVNAQRVRSVFRREFDQLWKRFDVMIAPSTPIVAPGRDQTRVVINGSEEDTRMASTRLARGIALLGEPAISIPCGTSGGLPIGLQLVAKPGDDARLLAVAQQVEKLL